jgi:hypothetical protein
MSVNRESFFWWSEEHILYFFCAVSGCDGGNRTRNIAVDAWRFSLLSYGRHPQRYDFKIAYNWSGWIALE